MPEENLINDKAIQSATGHAPELPERSATETAAEAERTIADIDKVVADFRAQEAVTNPDDVHELESTAQSSVAQVQEVLHTQDDSGLESTIKENTNTPEYKKAQDYAKQVQVKIANILQSISDDRLRGKAQFKLDKLSKSFWFFCKEMAFNDMEEFDYNSKISMMESNYQKVLVEIDAVSADFLAKDKKKVPNPEVSKVTPVENPVGATSDDQSIETVKQDESTVSAETDSQSVAVEPKNIDVVVEDNIQATDQGPDKFQELENLHRTMTQASSKTKFSLGKLNRKKRTIESTINSDNSDATQEMPLAVDNDFSYNQAQSWEALYLALSNKLGSAAEPIMDRLRLVELGDRSTPEELSKTEGMTPEIIEAVAGLRHKPFEESHEDFQYFENLYNYIERIVLPDRAKKIIKNIEAFRAGKISEEVLAAGLQPLYSGWVVPVIKSLLAKEAEGSTAFVVQKPAVPEQTPESVKSAEIESLSSEESNVLAPEIVDVPKNTPTQSTEPVNPEPIPNPDPVPTPEPVLTPEPVIPDKVEKDLGYLDIDPKIIWEKMTPKDMEALQALMKAGDMTKINEFYQSKIKEVLVDQKKESASDEVLMKQIAESVNSIIQNQIQHELDSELLKTDWKDKGLVAAKIAKNIVIMGGASLAIGALGVGTGGLGIAATAATMTLVRFAMKKNEAKRKKRTDDSTKEAERLGEAKKKEEILEAIFSPDNAEKLRAEISGHIANVLREQSSGRALKALKEYKRAKGEKEKEVLDSNLRDVEKILYLNALTKVRTEHPDATPEQQQNMALTLALTLGQHERGENLAKQRLEAIKKSKPDLYKLIEKFNLLNAGSPDKKPAGMSKEEESLWDKSKYDLMSLGIGTAVGFAVRSSDFARVAMGAIAGAGLGYKIGQAMEKRDEKKALAEIAKMIDESETKIRDIEFPTEEIEQLKKDSIFVKSKLDLGFLDSDPLLKSRAENFIHQVQKIELANQESFKKLLDSVSSRTDKRAEQVEEDLNRIGSKIKNRRLWTTIGGAVLGGAAALWLDEHFNKKESDPDKIVDSKPGDATASTDSTLGVEQPRPPQVTGNPYFEDKIDSTNMSGPDSIWRSTHQIFEDHAKELGYKGDLNDQQALSAWAENQTANAVQHLNQDQGGNLADLVHDGDKVKIAFINGKPVLSFEASSGLEAGHLADSNVADLAAGQKFGTGIDHNLVMDQSTGDQFLEIKSGSDIYRVYDWDRDAQPNVIFPDGHTQEMSVGDLNKLLAEKNILAVENAKIESTVDTVTATAPEVVAANITEQKVEDFINNGSDYTRDVYESAKNSGHMSDLVSSVVKGENPVQTGALISDYARDSGWSEDKIKIFLNAVRSGEKIDLSSGQFDTNDPDIILKNMEAFERSALDNFDKVKDMPAEHWIPARIGDQYFNIQKIHSGFWPARSDHWLIDTNGDFATDAIKLDDHAMRAAFSQDKIELTREALEKLSGKK